MHLQRGPMAMHKVNHEEQGSITAQRPHEQYDVLDALPDGVVLVDASRVVQYANPAACALLQCSVEQLRGTYFLRQFPEHEREYIAARCGAGTHGGWSSVQRTSAGAELA